MYDFFSVEHWDRLWRLCVAQILMLVLFLLDTVTFSTSMMSMFRPAFFVMGVFYWAIYRPSLLSVFWICILGVIYDAVLHYPLGLHSILFLVIQYVSRSQRLFFMGQSFVTIWGGFGIVISLFLFLEWMVFSVISFDFVGIKPMIFSFLFSWLIFPFISFILFFIHRMLPISQNHHLVGDVS